MLLRYSVIGLLRLIRYRFFLFAGIFPYLIGQVIASDASGVLNWYYFWLGFLGIFLVLIGVELFNEYFDAKEGGDRIFLKEKFVIPYYFFLTGIFVFILAFFICLYLTFHIGWPIFLFSFLGFLASYFYVGPPIRWAYRGLGELAIALSYGPFMVLGSYYLQTERIDTLVVLVSLILGSLIFSLAIVNEIPDYIQDKLVGKKNLVVRFGKEKAIYLFGLGLLCTFSFLVLGICFRQIPLLVGIAFLILPWILKSIRIIQKEGDNPRSFVFAINTNITGYLIITSLLAIGYLIKS